MQWEGAKKKKDRVDEIGMKIKVNEKKTVNRNEEQDREYGTKTEINEKEKKWNKERKETQRKQSEKK